MCFRSSAPLAILQIRAWTATLSMAAVARLLEVLGPLAATTTNILIPSAILGSIFMLATDVKSEIFLTVR
jgi:hypothetical protein